MKTRKLNEIAQEAIKSTEADMVIVMYNNDNHIMEVVPFWEFYLDSTNELTPMNKKSMIDRASETLAYCLISFADSNGCESIGTFAIRFEEDDK